MLLKPSLGPLQLAFYGIGIVVGAGVYSVIGTAAGIAQQSLWLSFVLGAVVALLTGFSYAEMTASSFIMAGIGAYFGMSAELRGVDQRVAKIESITTASKRIGPNGAPGRATDCD
jgi:amino acid transporter